MDKLSALIDRLEAAVDKLQSGASSGGATSGDSSTIVAEFEDLLNGSYSKFISLAKKIGDLTAAHADLFDQAVRSEFELMKTVSKSKKPADIQSVVQPISSCIQNVVDFREKNRANKDHFNFLSAISEAVPALGWVVVAPTPAPHVEEMANAAKFYTNKILTEFKSKDASKVDWANSFIDFLKELQAYVKKNHTTGLTWNSKGVEVSVPASTKVSAAAPPPKVGSEPTAEAKSSLFAALNAGDNVATGLKHVSKDMKTKNLPPEQKSSVVPATSTTSTPKKEYSGIQNPPGSKPPKFEREGVKWVVEHQVGNKNIVISETNPKQTVYIYKCADSVIQVQGKVNAITVDGCIKTGLVFESAISACEAVNCSSLQIQVSGKVPSVAIDKSSGVQIFLSKESMETEIITSKSSEMNVLIPKQDDMIELPVPEQYKTRVVNNKLVTEQVSHTAA